MMPNHASTARSQWRPKAHGRAGTGLTAECSRELRVEQPAGTEPAGLVQPPAAGRPRNRRSKDAPEKPSRTGAPEVPPGSSPDQPARLARPAAVMRTHRVTETGVAGDCAAVALHQPRQQRFHISERGRRAGRASRYATVAEELQPDEQDRRDAWSDLAHRARDALESPEWCRQGSFPNLVEPRPAMAGPSTVMTARARPTRRCLSSAARSRSGCVRLLWPCTCMCRLLPAGRRRQAGWTGRRPRPRSIRSR